MPKLLFIFAVPIIISAWCCANAGAQDFDTIEKAMNLSAASDSRSISPFDECRTCKPQREPSEILWIPTIGLGVWYWRKRRKENLVVESEDGLGNATPKSNANPYSTGADDADLSA